MHTWYVIGTHERGFLRLGGGGVGGVGGDGGDGGVDALHQKKREKKKEEDEDEARVLHRSAGNKVGRQFSNWTMSIAHRPV